MDALPPPPFRTTALPLPNPCSADSDHQGLMAQHKNNTTLETSQEVFSRSRTIAQCHCLLYIKYHCIVIPTSQLQRSAWRNAPSVCKRLGKHTCHYKHLTIHFDICTAHMFTSYSLQYVLTCAHQIVYFDTPTFFGPPVQTYV